MVLWTFWIWRFLRGGGFRAYSGFDGGAGVVKKLRVRRNFWYLSEVVVFCYGFFYIPGAFEVFGEDDEVA